MDHHTRANVSVINVTASAQSAPKKLIWNTISLNISSHASHGGTLTSPQMAVCVLCCVVHERACAYHLLQHVGGFDGAIHHLFGRLLDLPPHQELVQDEVSLLEVKDDIQLTHLRGDTEAEGETYGETPARSVKDNKSRLRTLPKYLSSSST